MLTGRLKLGWVLIWLLAQSFALQAGAGRYIKSLQGPDIGINASFLYQDNFFSQYSNSGQGSDFCIQKSNISIRLRYDQLETLSASSQDFSVHLVYDVKLYKNDYSTIDIHSKVLNVDFNNDDRGKHQDIDLHIYDDQLYIAAKVTVKSVQILDGNGVSGNIPVPDDLYLDILQDVDRVFDLDQTSSAIPTMIKTPGSGTYGTEAVNELMLSWNGIEGAESYDLEWLYVNTGDNATLSDFNVDFKNASRVNINEPGYQLSLIYPKGYLVYRVRSRGYDKDLYCNSGKLKEVTGAWSGTNNVTLASFIQSHSDYVALEGFGPSYNWAYSINYAEEGKTMEGMQFFDGTLRGRQSVATSNADGNVVISETLYDHDGRPVVQLAPFPTTSQGMKFYKNGSNSIHGNFDKVNFNTDAHLNPYDLTAKPEQLDPTTSLSAQYYSSLNNSSSPYRNAIPDAKGYAYSQVFYENDGTGRVKAISGLGGDYHINSGNESRNYYLNVRQEELNRLFGSEVGYQRFYRKVISKDANGQFSVAYIDYQGKTIATALTGDAPDNLLDADDKGGTTAINSDLLSGGQLKSADGTFIKTDEFSIIPGNGNLTYHYDVEPITVNMDCMSSSITGKYDIQFYIVNDFNQVVESISSTGSGPNTVYNSNPKVLASVNQNISTAGYPVGAYSMVKSIKVNEDFLEDEYDAYKASLELEMKTQLSFWEHQLKNYYLSAYGYSGTNPGNALNPCIAINLPDVEPCDLDCENACENELRELRFNASTNTFYYEYYFYDQNDNDIRKLDPNQSIHSEYTADVEACTTLCAEPNVYSGGLNDCERMEQKLLKDLSPGGQYFDNTPKKYEVNNITGTFYDLNGNKTVVSNYYCSAPGCQGAVINGWLENHPAVNALLGTAAVDGYGSWDEVRDNWDDKYAEELLRFHPEISYYNFHCKGSISMTGLDKDRKPETTAISMLNEINKYANSMYSVTGTCPEFSYNGKTYNGAMPFGGSENMGSNTELYMSDFCTGSSTSYSPDPLMIYTLQSGGQCTLNTAHNYTSVSVQEIGQKILTQLQQFVDVNGTYHSIWYVLENPKYPSNYPTTWTNEVKELYRGIHGTSSTAGDGVVGPGGLSKYEYFRGVYDFYRNHFIYQYFKNVYNYTPWQRDLTFTGTVEDWSTSTRLTGTIEDDYKLNFVENAIYAGIYADGISPLQNPNFSTFNPSTGILNTSNPSNLSTEFETYQKQLIYQSAVGTVAQLMIELNDACLQGLSTQEIKELRENLVLLCQEGGIQARDAIADHNNGVVSLTPQQLNKYQLASMSGMTSLISSSITLTVTGGVNPGTHNVSNADDLVDHYVGSCGVDLEYPVVPNGTTGLASAMECNCDKIEAIYTGSSFTNNPNDPGFSAVAANIAGTLSGINSTQVESWLTVCYNKQGTFVPDVNDPAQASWLDYPQDLECYDCKCDAFQDVLDQNGILATASQQITGAELTLLNSVLGLTGADQLSTADVSNILNECKLASNISNFNNFPEALRCLGEPVVSVADLQHIECLNKAIEMALASAKASYEQKMDDKLSSFKSELKTKLMANIFEQSNSSSREELTVSYNLNEYYYTLYYYDQAGNLVKTVPPEGVRPIDLSATPATAVSGCSGCNNNAAIKYIREQKLSTSDFIYPDHKMITRYTYNSYNQLTEHNSPDAGKSEYWYDEADRLVVSQNSKQNPNDKYSYTQYDELGRITEVGQLTNTTSLTPEVSYGSTSLNTWMNSVGVQSSREQVTVNQYNDKVLDGQNDLGQINFKQENLRNRVSASFYFDSNPAQNPDVDNDDLVSAIYYSYDDMGLMRSMAQQNNVLKLGGGISGHIQKIDYSYDLISGNVNEVAYQDGRKDAFYHRYYYDRNNRLTEVYMSQDKQIWNRQSKYFYYEHGPLARKEIGDKKVQAEDYAYTINGWLKGVNAGTLKSTRDLGHDGQSQDLNKNKFVAQDAFGFTLTYYDRDKSGALLKDYTSIGNTAGFEPQFSGSTFANADFSSSTNLSNINTTDKVSASLYNGNISRMVVALQDQDQEDIAVHNNVYRYDQLNRIKTSTVYRNIDANGVDQLAASNSLVGVNHNQWSYATQYQYDRNGNLKKLNRNGVLDASTGSQTGMDQLEYFYSYNTSNSQNTYLENNKLLYVTDNATSAYTTDIDGQNSGNYQYDQIGNLTADAAEGISNIEWTVSGKVKKITRLSSSDKDDLEFIYDPYGRRIAKIVKPKKSSGPNWILKDEMDWETHIYVRDASGNVMANYIRKFKSGSSNLEDLNMVSNDIYGSARLGAQKRGVNVRSASFSGTPGAMTNVQLSGSGALSFDGVDDRVTISNNSALNLSNELTYEAWIKPTTVSGQMVILAKQWCSGNQFSYYFSMKEGKLRWVWTASGSCGSAVELYESSEIVIEANKWQHVAVVHTTSSVKLYVDGVEVDGALRSGDSYSSLKVSNVPLRIGTYQNTDGSYALSFSGEIDEVRLWDDQRTEPEILTFMSKELLGNEGGLVGYWKLDELSGQVVHNETGNSLDGVLGTSSSAENYDPSWVAEGHSDAQSRKALSFDGTSDYVTIPNKSVFNITGSLTYEAWIRPTRVSGNNMIVSQQWCSGNRHSYYFTIIDGHLRWNWDNDGNCSNGTAGGYDSDDPVIMPNQWQHVAVVHTGTSVQMYLNGQPISGHKYRGSYTSIYHNNLPIRIGTYRANGGNFALFFEGDIDEVRFWNDQRTDAEIFTYMNQSLYGYESNLVACWNFDEPSGQTVLDISSNMANGYLGASTSTESVDPTRVVNTESKKFYRELGNTQYELSNHLGNVLSVVTDRKILSDDNVEVEEFLFDQQSIYFEDFNDGTVGGFSVWDNSGITTFENNTNQLEFVCNSSPGAIVKNLSIENGKNYELVFNVDFQGSSNSIRIVMFDKNYSKFLEKEFTSMSDGIIRVPFKGQTDMVRIVVHSNYVSNSYLLDNFQLLKGDMGAWYAYDNSYKANVENGKLYIQTSTFEAGGIIADYDFIPNHDYIMYFDADLNGSANLNWNIAAIDMASTPFVWTNSPNLVDGANTFAFTAGANPNGLTNSTRFKLRILNSNSSNVEIWLDNIRIVDVTEKQYIADVISTSDYYLFGSIMPGRKFNTPEYAYGHGGQLADDEITNNRSHYSAEYWEYDSRLGRRWNVDPITYSWQSSYATFNNNPIVFNDPRGLKGVKDWFKKNKSKSERNNSEENEADGTTYSEDGNSRTNGTTTQTYREDGDCYTSTTMEGGCTGSKPKKSSKQRGDSFFSGVKRNMKMIGQGAKELGEDIGDIFEYLGDGLAYMDQTGSDEIKSGGGIQMISKDGGGNNENAVALPGARPALIDGDAFLTLLGGWSAGNPDFTKTLLWEAEQMVRVSNVWQGIPFSKDKNSSVAEENINQNTRDMNNGTTSSGQRSDSIRMVTMWMDKHYDGPLKFRKSQDTIILKIDTTGFQESDRKHNDDYIILIPL